MTRSEDGPTIHIEGEGRTLASAEVHPADEGGVAHSALHVESGQLPKGTRARLVDAVLDTPEVKDAHALLATMPAGDTEMIDRLRERAPHVEPRLAGATKLVDVRLDPED